MICGTLMKKLKFWKITATLYQISIPKRLLSNETIRDIQAKDDVHFFGHQKVSSTEKRDKVQALFTNVAEKYDLMNDVMTAGIHRGWKDYFVHTLSPIPGMKLLDVAGGTGDIAFRFIQAVSSDDDALQFQTMENQINSHVTVFDINPNMLAICKNRASAKGLKNSLTCIQGNAELLPFPDNTFDAYTIAFGIRNVVHREEALAEAHRVLRPGGHFLCLEFSKVRNGSFDRLYQWYSKEIIPVLGELIAGDWKAYQYLVESIEQFPSQEEFSDMIQDAGFNTVTHENLCNGIAAIHSAYKL